MAYAFYLNKYASYFIRHTYSVCLAWKDIQDIIIENGIISEEELKIIDQLIIQHDASKLSKAEFEDYAAKFYPELLKTDENGFETIKIKFKAAWEHHKKENTHHWETLKDYTGSDWKCHLVDLICDWIAMGWETGVLYYEYYAQNKETIQLPVEYQKELEVILALIKASGCYANGKLTSEQQSRLVFKEEFYDLFLEDRKKKRL